MTPSRLESLSTVFTEFKTVRTASEDMYGNYIPVDPKTLNLESNFGPMDADAIGFLQPTSMETPLETMRERFERDGYLFVGCYIVGISTHKELG